MKQKRYFDRFTIGTVVFFIIIFGIAILGKFSKHFLTKTDLKFGNEKSKFVYENAILLELMIQAVATAMFLYALYCFYQFMSNANKGRLFSNHSVKYWKRISTIFIIYGIGFLLSGFVDSTYFSGCIVAGLISSISYSFSKIFADGSILQQENDLTI